MKRHVTHRPVSSALITFVNVNISSYINYSNFKLGYKIINFILHVFIVNDLSLATRGQNR